MKTYYAESFGVAFVYTPVKHAAYLNPRLELLNLSPGGFSWGKYGRASGDHQLALAILCDAYDYEKALRFYERFAKRAIYTRNREAPFEMKLDQVLEHVEAIEKETTP